MVLLCRSLLNFLRTFASLIRSSFFEFGKILPNPRGIPPSFFAPGQRIRQKNLPEWPGLARSKKFSPGLLGGMYPAGIDWDIMVPWVPTRKKPAEAGYLPRQQGFVHRADESCCFVDILFDLAACPSSITYYWVDHVICGVPSVRSEANLGFQFHAESMWEGSKQHRVWNIGILRMTGEVPARLKWII